PRATDQRSAELSAVTAALAHEHPDALAGRNVAALPIRDALLGNMKPILASLLGAVALLLVIMGANLALLMLTRYVERAPELAMLGRPLHVAIDASGAALSPPRWLSRSCCSSPRASSP